MDQETYKKEIESINKRRQEITELYQKHLIEEYSEKLKTYIGKFYKFRNSYSPDEEWFEYIQVIDIVSDSIFDHGAGISFRCTVKRYCKLPDGEIRINLQEDASSRLLEIEVSESEFTAYKQEIIASIH